MRGEGIGGQKDPPFLYFPLKLLQSKKLPPELFLFLFLTFQSHT